MDKIHTFLNKYTLSFFAFTIPVLIYLQYDFSKFVKYDTDEKMAIFQKEFKNVVSFYGEVLDIKTSEIASKKEVLEALRNTSGENLKKEHDKLLQTLNLDYYQLRELGVTLLHIHTADKKSLIRFHNPEVYGDSLKDVRPSINISQDNQKTIAGYEVGKYFTGYRLVRPIIANGVALGSIEASIPFENILKKLNTISPSYYSAIINKKYFKEKYELDNLRESDMSNDYIEYKIVVNSIENIALVPKLDKLLSETNLPLEKGKSFLQLISDEEFNYYTVMFERLTNVNGENIGYLVKYKKNFYYLQVLLEYITKGVIFTIFIGVVLFLIQKREIYHMLLLQYKDAVDQSNIVSKTDPRGIIKYVNSKFCETSGYSEEELLGKPHNIIRHPDMPSSAFKGLWKSIQSGKPWRGIVKNRKKDGSTYIVDALIMPVLDENGNVIEYLGIRHDITELENYREILEKQLVDKSEGLKEKINLIKEYEKTIDASTAYSRTNKDAIITYVNEKFCELSGYSREELIGKNHNIIRHPDNSDTLYKDMWLSISNLKPWKSVIRNKKKNGDDYYIDITIAPILDTAGKVVEYMAISHDVTELSKLNKEIFETQKELVQTVGTIGEFRSQETGMHVKRVSEYGYLFAKLIGMSEEEATLIKTASPLHDIGKIAIPDKILNKPAALTQNEFATIKKHSLLGYEMLKVSNRPIIKAAAIIAKEHHERWDGKGYPDGLKEDEIHIYGRIIAIADVFDALGTDRVYKKAWDVDEILAYMIDERGKQFDPILIDIFFKNIKKFIEIKEKYKDIKA